MHVTGNMLSIISIIETMLSITVTILRHSAVHIFTLPNVSQHAYARFSRRFFACVHHGGGCWVLPCLTSCDILDTTRRRRAAARRRGIKARLVYGVACLLSSLFGWCPTEQIIPPLISYRNLHYWIFNTGAGNGKTCSDPCQKIFLQELEYEGDK